ncbi:MAG TPA: hypothetical protein VFG04_12925 [Planctomycetaceae bacterium]|nr:hypothetical protein [Planctomycetaceae bacterium]
MQDKFWRTIAALMCVGLFYVGHGLHGPQHAGIPAIESTANAADVAWHPDSPEMFTSGQDGRTVYAWKRFKDVREGAIVVRYIGRTDVPAPPAEEFGQNPSRAFPGRQVPGRAPVPEPPIVVAPAK